MGPVRLGAANYMRRRRELSKSAKAHRGRRLQLYFKDPEVVSLLDLLKTKWATEGKIPGPSYSGAVEYMASHFAELARSPTKDTRTLPFDAYRRQKLALISKTFRLAGVTRSEADMETLASAVDYLYEILKDEQVLERFVMAKGELRNREDTNR